MTKKKGREYAEEKSWEKERKDVAMARLRDGMIRQGCWDNLSEEDKHWIQDHADSAMQPSDFRDNSTGRDCGECVEYEKDCESCCREKGLNENTPEGPDTDRPFGPFTPPGSTNKKLCLIIPVMHPGTVNEDS